MIKGWIEGMALKFMESKFSSSVQEALYKFIGKNVPLWLGQRIKDYVDKGYLGNPDLFSVINKISTMGAHIPWKFYFVNNKGEEEEIVSHAIIDTWNRPNPGTGGIQFRKEMLDFFLATGNTYIEGIGPENGVNSGQWQELYLMPSQSTEIITGDDFRNIVKAYKVNSFTKHIPAETVVHIRNSNIEYDQGTNLYGLSPIRAGIKPVTSSNDAYTAKAAKLQNKGVEGFIAAGKDGVEKEQIAGLEKLYNKKKGPHNAGKIGFSGGNVKWHPMGVSFVDLQILESIKADLRTICNIYGVSSGLFNDPEGSTYNNKREEKKAAYTDVVKPLLFYFADDLNRTFCKSFSQEGKKIIMRPDFSGVEVLQKEVKEMTSALDAAWWLTGDQKLEIMGFEKTGLPEMEKRYIPAGRIPLDDLGFDSDEIDKAIKELKKLGIDV